LKNEFFSFSIIIYEEFVILYKQFNHVI